MRSGFRFYTGKSMRTTFRQGDCILYRQVRPDTLRTGDIVLYRTDPDPGIDTVHRIVSLDGNRITVRGDDTDQADTETVQADRIIGKVVSIERNGRRLPVVSGTAGGIWAALVSPRGFPRRLAGVLYRLLKRSRIVRVFWRPGVEAIRIETDQETVLRLVSSGRTVGMWCPDREILVLRKPWDLVISSADCPCQL
jgi:hypothetical protein